MSGETTQEMGGSAADAVVVRRSERGWQVGAEETADLTSAMVLAPWSALYIHPSRVGRRRGGPG